MGRESSLLPSSTRVRDGDAHHDDIYFFTWQQVNYGLTFMITFNYKKTLLTKTDMNEVNEVCSWKDTKYLL
jgi:hypothetical protein